VMALNLRAPFFLSQAAAAHLKQSHGAIVNIADLAAFETWPAYLPHGISKSGIVDMTRALAMVLAPEVRVAAIAPGTVLLPEGWSDEGAEHLIATTPLRRNGNPKDVTDTVLFILDSDYLTGETIIVDGGRHVRK
jgi:pteridine reductase